MRHVADNSACAAGLLLGAPCAATAVHLIRRTHRARPSLTRHYSHLAPRAGSPWFAAHGISDLGDAVEAMRGFLDSLPPGLLLHAPMPVTSAAAAAAAAAAAVATSS